MINRDRLLDILIALIKIDSPSKKENNINRYLRKYFKNIADSCLEDDAAKKINGESGNLIFKIKGNLKQVAPLSFWAHMDTVTSTAGIKIISQKNLIKTAETTILGSDDKAGIASLCEVCQTIKEKNIPHGDLEIVFTVAEEIGLLGSQNLNFDLIQSKIAYILDCNGNLGTVITQAPSAKKIKVHIKGKAAHAGIEPEKGINAIAIASSAIANMKLAKVNKDTTANIGKIVGGEATNIIPEEVNLEGEARSFSDFHLKNQIAHMKKCFLKASRKYKGTFDFKDSLEYSAFLIKPSSPALKLVKKAINSLKLPYLSQKSGGGSDANVLNKHRIQALNLGIGMQNAHTKKEFILKKDLENTAKLVLEIIKTST